MENSNDIKSALIDVRKAYRLLYEYQKRVLDLIILAENMVFHMMVAGLNFAIMLRVMGKVF